MTAQPQKSPSAAMLESYVRGDLPGSEFERVRRALATSADLRTQLTEIEASQPRLGWAAKVLRGDRNRLTRLHDEQGNRLPVRRFPNAFRGIASLVASRVGVAKPVVPWISFDAIARLDRLLESDWTVVEYGSGLSTLWFAERVRRVIAIEHDPSWYHLVADELSCRGVKNVDLRLHHELDDGYAELPDLAPASVDFCLVDGIFRLACCRSALTMLKPGGYLYLDNSDVTRDPERMEAVRLLESASKTRGNTPEFFVDFAPNQAVANQGCLVRL